MTQKKMFKSSRPIFVNTMIRVFSLFFIFISCMQGSLFSQMKTYVPNKEAQDSSNRIIIHQEVNFEASPQKIYQALLNSKEFSACTKKSFSVFSEKSATIDSAIGGSFSLFDGHIVGRIVELVPNRRIVEAWRVVDWPEGQYSIVKFELSSHGTGTHLSFDHIGFPEGWKDHLASGWQEHYWNALTNYFQ
jgi:activator of HSP90 ATPase